MTTEVVGLGESDLARRMLRRQAELGLSSREVARHVGIDPNYSSTSRATPLPSYPVLHWHARGRSINAPRSSQVPT